MLIISIELRQSSYAACPWNNAHIEGIVEWPPSPWRNLRAIIAGFFLAQRVDIELNQEDLESIILTLAKSQLKYYLPKGSYVQLCTYRKDRNDKSSLYGSGKLLSSGELRFSPEDRTIYLFWDVQLNQEQLLLLGSCLKFCRYLGRSESVALWKIEEDVQLKPNCSPDSQGTLKVLAPGDDITFSDFLKSPRQIFDTERRQYIPGATWLSYTLKENASISQFGISEQQNNYARVAFIAKFPLRKDSSLYYADKLHKTLTSHCSTLNFTGIDPTLENQNEKYCRSNNHVYLIPIINKGIVTDFELYCANEFTKKETSKLAKLRKLYTKSGEINIRLCAIGRDKDYTKPSKIWQSKTPMFLPRIPATRRGLPRMIQSSVFQKDGPEHQALKLLLHLPQFEHLKKTKITYVPSNLGLQQWVDDSLFCVAQATIFQQWWKWSSDRAHGKKAVREGYSIKLSFTEPQFAPIAIGYSAHFGLGAFRPLRGRVGVENGSQEKKP